MTGELTSHLSMTHQLIDLIYVMWFYQRPIKPGGFVSAVRRFANEQGMEEFGGFRQGDASEFMNFMLDMLDTCLNAKVEDDEHRGNVRTRSQKIKDEFVKTHNGSISEIANMFHIMTCMNIRDLEGRDESSRYQ